MPGTHKYARIERERRFLVNRLPDTPKAVRVRRIVDRYLEGTTLRLREQRDDGGAIFKLTQKLPSPGRGARQGLITNIYLSEDEFCLLSRLPAKKLLKTRYSVPPFGIDVFQGRLRGLVLAEAEFDSAAAARALELPAFVVSEVTADIRFTGGQLVRASRRHIRNWLSEYGLGLDL